MPLMRNEPPLPPVGWQTLLRAAAGHMRDLCPRHAAVRPRLDRAGRPAILFAAALCLGFTTNRTCQLTAPMVSATAILRILAATWD